LSKLEVWWVAGTDMPPGAVPFRAAKPFTIVGGNSFDDVHRTLLFCRRDAMPIGTITSPEGIEMTEAEFYSLWASEKSKGNA
jgi:hypothetical protein